MASRKQLAVLAALCATATVGAAACSGDTETAPLQHPASQSSGGATEQRAQTTAPGGATTDTPALAPENNEPNNPPGAVANPTTTAAPADPVNCTIADPQAVARAAAAQIPPAFSDRDIPWVPDTYYPNNLDACRDLSFFPLTIQGATGSSPDQLLIFHKGEFQGTGTKCNLGFQSIDTFTDESVTVTYRWPRGDDANANPTGAATVTYRWNGSGVQMDGTLPAELTHGEC